MGTLALIGLGSNLGDRKALLDGAVAALAETPGVKLNAVSTYRETAPVGGPSGQGPFLNAAAAVESSLDPFPLLARLQEIEDAAGRIRCAHWGARTLDLDLLLFGDQTIQTETLAVPHPRMALRRFVLAPLTEIAPEAVDPVTGRTVTDLLANLDRRPRYLALSWDVAREEPGRTFEWQIQLPGINPFMPGFDPLEQTCRDEPSTQKFTLSDLGMKWLRLLLSRPPVPPIEDLLEPFAHMMAETARSLDSNAELWIITDFWYDELYHFHRRTLSNPRDVRLFRERFLALRCLVPAPTLVVVQDSTLERIGAPDILWPGPRPLGGEVSRLRLPSGNPGRATQEILAACIATRTG